MPKKQLTLTSNILLSLLMAGDMFLFSPSELRRRALMGQPFGKGESFRKIAYYLAQKGLIRYIDKNNQKFIQLTNKGQLEALLVKANTAIKPKAWDGKWRVIIFDIPEESRNQRAFFRKLLKNNNFKKLQASVFVSPYPINREAIVYLKQTKLMDYIRMLKVEEMDDDKKLRKIFGV